MQSTLVFHVVHNCRLGAVLYAARTTCHLTDMRSLDSQAGLNYVLKNWNRHIPATAISIRNGFRQLRSQVPNCRISLLLTDHCELPESLAESRGIMGFVGMKCSFGKMPHSNRRTITACRFKVSAVQTPANRKLINLSTRLGSNWEPAHLRNSANASSGGRPGR